MDSRFVVAQGTSDSTPRPATPRLVKVAKPDGGQSITIVLDGAVKLDLSGIANEHITLVHVGDRLVILFDNQATITLAPFYAPNGQPFDGITVELAPDRDVSGAAFASLFPLTDDASVLPAAGNGPTSGGNFAATPVVDILVGGTPSELPGHDVLPGSGGFSTPPENRPTSTPANTPAGDLLNTPANNPPTAVADTGAAVEAGVHPGNTAFAGTAVATGNVLAGDSDPDGGDVLRVVGVTAGGSASEAQGNVGATIAGTYGSLVINPDGSFTYTLDNTSGATQALAQDAKASDVFHYTIADAAGARATTTLTIDVTGTNDAPVIGAALTPVEGGEFAGLQASPEPHQASGTLTFTDVDVPDQHQVGVALAAARWSAGTTIPQATALDIAGALTATLAGDSAGASHPGTVSWTFSLPDHDVDFLADGEKLDLVYTVTVTDRDGATAARDVTVTLIGSNDNPVADAVKASGAEDHAPVAVTLTGNDIDHGDHIVSFQLNGLPADGILYLDAAMTTAVQQGVDYAASDNALTLYFKPNQNWSGTTSFDYTAADTLNARSAAATAIIDISHVNHSPDIADGNDSGAVIEAGLDAVQQTRGTALASGTLAKSDVDADDNAGNDSWSVTAGAGQSQTDAMTVSGTYGSLSIDQDGHWTYTLDDTRPATQALALNVPATETFSIQVADSHGATATHDVTVAVTGSNDAPEIGGGNDTGSVIAAGRDAAQQARGTAVANGTLAKSDVDSDDNAGNDAWRVTAGAGQSQTDAMHVSGVYGSLSIDQDGHWIYTLDDARPATRALALDAPVTETFTIEVADSHGASASHDVTIAVTGSNDAPDIADGGDTGLVIEAGLDAAQQARGTALASGTLVKSDVDAGDNAGNDSWSVTAGAGQSPTDATTVSGTYGSLGIDQDGHWTYTLDDTRPATEALALDATATETFSIQVADSHGATTTHEVTVAVTGSNDAPEIGGGNDTGSVIAAGLDAAQQARGTAVASGTLAKSDVDSDDNAGNDAWRVTAGAGQSQTDAMHVSGVYGSLSIDQDGHWIYTLDDARPATRALALDAPATETFTIEVTDSHGATATREVTIAVTGSNDAPDIADGGDTGLVIEAGLDAAQQARGTALASGTLVKSDVDAGDNAGNDSWSVTAGAGQSQTDATTVSGTYGSLGIDEDGHWTYTLDDTRPATQALSLDAPATETFSIQVADSRGATTTHEVTVAVTGSNDAPEIGGGNDTGTVIAAGLDAAQQARGTAVASGTLAKSDVDADDNAGNDAWRVTAGSGQSQTDATHVSGAYGALSIDQDGHWIYTLDDTRPATQALALDAPATETFSIQVADSHGATLTHDVTVAVTGSNDAPTAQEVIAGSQGGGPIAVTLTGSDIDNGDQIASFRLVDLPADGKLYLDPAMTDLAQLGLVYADNSDELTLYFVPNDGWSGSDTVHYVATDSHGADSAPASATIVVAAPNAPPTITIADLNLVANGDFETGDFTGWQADADTVVPETVYTHLGQFDALLWDFNLGAPVSLSQTVQTTPGTVYLLDFFLENYSGNPLPPPNRFTVNWNGGTVLSVVNHGYDLVYTEYQVVVTGGAAPESVLQFIGDNPEGWQIDDVSLTRAILEDTPGSVVGASFADPDAAADLVDVTYTAPAGLFYANPAGNVGVSNSGTGTVTLHGAIADINAFVAGGHLTYASVKDFNGDVAVTITIDDLGHNGAGGAHSATATQILHIAPVNDAPVMQDASPVLAPLNINAGTPPAMSVADLLQSTVTDVDTGAVQGIGITGDRAAHGNWQYSIDGGASWIVFDGVTPGAALLLRATDLVRFVPDGTGAGAESFDYVAWDQTTGTAGTFADATARGDTTAFSTEINTASLTVRDNHAPVAGAPGNGAVAYHQSSSANQVTNGDFQTGNLTGWTPIGGPGNPASAQLEEIDMQPGGPFYQYGAAISGPNGISQTLQTIPGQHYTLSFRVPFAPGGNVLDAYWDGHLVAAVGASSGTYSFDVVATARQTELKFFAPVDDGGGTVDDIKVIGPNVAAQQSTSGTISFSDADPTDTHTATYTAQGAGYIGTFSVDPTATESNGAGSFGWHFSVNTAFLSQFVGLHTQTYSITIDDGHGGTAQDNVTITLKGVNRAPVVQSGTTLHFTEGQLPVAIDPHLTVSDSDGTMLVGATVAITGNFLAGHDILGFTAQNGITGSYDAASGVLTLTGLASVANYQDALRAVTYFDAGDPNALTRTISFRVDDGEQLNHLGDAATATVMVSLPTEADNAVVITSGHQAGLAMAVPMADLITNGGFETGDLTNWALHANADRTSVNGNLVAAGAYSVETGASIYGGLEQIIATLPGVHYTLSFDLADSRPGAPADPSNLTTFPGMNAFFALWNFTETVFQRQDDHLAGFRHYSFDVVGGGSASFLDFQSWNYAPNYWYIDNVSLTPSTVDAHGSIAFSDADVNDTHTASFLAQGSGYLGSFALDPTISESGGSGSVGWHFSVSDADLLNLGSTSRTQIYTVTVHDGFVGGDASQEVAVTLLGPGLEHPLLISDFGAHFFAMAPLLDSVPANATVHFEGISNARVFLADGITQVQSGTDLTADQFAGLLLNPNGTNATLAGYFAYSVSDGASLTEHKIPVTLFSGFNGATINGTALNETLVGSNYGDVLNGGAGNDRLTGGGGADRFVFDHDALTDAQAAQPKLDQILDYSNAQGDTIDISQLLATAFGQGEQASDRVQVKEDASGAFATLQVDPDGAANGAHFTTIAQLNGAHVGDIITVMLDHAQQAAQLHVS